MDPKPHVKSKHDLLLEFLVREVMKNDAFKSAFDDLVGAMVDTIAETRGDDHAFNDEAHSVVHNAVMDSVQDALGSLLDNWDVHLVKDRAGDL